MSIGFNCTIMELKYLQSVKKDWKRWSFNCTIMELKLHFNDWKWIEPQVLIVPLWNWNQWVWSYIASSKDRFNCTIMELKLYSSSTSRIRCEVLIVPLWNWNITTLDGMFDDAEVLIVPYWNWNKTEQHNKALAEAVLIVPLWNWNLHHIKGIVHRPCFNCTIMELKLAMVTSMLTTIVF